MRKVLLAGTAFTLVILGANTGASAQTASTADLQKQIQTMQQQLQQLQQQLSDVKSQPVSKASSESVTQSIENYMNSDKPLTWHGVTLYGTLDVGVSSQSHGAAFNADYAPGVEELLGKNGNHSVTGLTGNGLSQSNFGIKGEEQLFDGLSVVFKAEGGFDPVSGTLANGVKSVTDSNGVAVTSQSSNGDSSRAGQVFNNVSFAGLSSPTFGTMTFGRHTGVLADAVIASDPVGGSYAFSVVGYSGTAGGGGSTENFRLDDSIKYNLKYGPVRFAAMYQFPGNTNAGDTKHSGKGDDAVQVGLGLDYMGATLDGVFAKKKDSVSASPSAALTAALTNNTVNATISDNTSFGVFATYKVDFLPVKLFAAYEQIRYENPSQPLPLGGTTIGGYVIQAVNNNAYATSKTLHYYWTGLKYNVTSDLSVTPAYYRIEQDNYSNLSQAACLVSKTVANHCDGYENVGSLSLDYAFTKRFDVYGGVMYSRVDEGLYNGTGFLHNNNVSEMVGGRFRF